LKCVAKIKLHNTGALVQVVAKVSAFARIVLGHFVRPHSELERKIRVGAGGKLAHLCCRLPQGKKLRVDEILITAFEIAVW
jgi:hypothetical protein